MSATICGVTNQSTYNTTASVPAILEDGTNAYVNQRYVYGPSGEAVERISAAGVASYFVSSAGQLR